MNTESDIIRLQCLSASRIFFFFSFKDRCLNKCIVLLAKSRVEEDCLELNFKYFSSIYSG